MANKQLKTLTLPNVQGENITYDLCPDWENIDNRPSNPPIVDNISKLLDEKYKPVDKFTEQRKWVRKLCWFWDDEKEEKVCGILTTIDSDCGLSDRCPYWNDTTSNWFEHCEPVKPDDDIIYKGGNNE